MARQARNATTYVAYVPAHEGSLPVDVVIGASRRKRVKGKWVTQECCYTRRNGLGVPTGREIWVESHLVKRPAPTHKRGAAERRRDNKRRALQLARMHGTAGRLSQGSDRTERTEVPRTEGQADASQDVTVATVSVANILECQQCWSEVHAPIGADTAICADCKCE